MVKGSTVAVKLEVVVALCATACEVVGRDAVSGPTGEGRSFETEDCATAWPMKTRPLRRAVISFIVRLLDVVVQDVV